LASHLTCELEGLSLILSPLASSFCAFRYILPREQEKRAGGRHGEREEATGGHIGDGNGMVGTSSRWNCPLWSEIEPSKSRRPRPIFMQSRAEIAPAFVAITIYFYVGKLQVFS